MEAIRYIVRDVRTKKDPTDYVTSILVYSKNISLTLNEVV